MIDPISREVRFLALADLDRQLLAELIEHQPARPAYRLTRGGKRTRRGIDTVNAEEARWLVRQGPAYIGAARAKRGHAWLSAMGVAPADHLRVAASVAGRQLLDLAYLTDADVRALKGALTGAAPKAVA